MTKSIKADITDEKCIELYRSGQEAMVDILMDRYKNMVKAKADTMYLLGGDKQDLIQEGMIGLFKAVRDYDGDKEASFYTFAQLCVTRQIIGAIQASGRLKHLPLNEYISLYSERGGAEGEEGVALLDTLAADISLEPENKLVSDEGAENIFHLVDKILTDRERKVFILHLTGVSTAQIGDILSIGGKSADNALQRARNKLKKAIKE